MFGKKDKHADPESGSGDTLHEDKDEYAGLGEYDALAKYINDYRDRNEEVDDDLANAEDADKPKSWWQFWRRGNSGNAQQGDAGYVPEEWMDVDIKRGIASSDVEGRRRHHGWNEITTEKENMFLKFLGYFTGPILYGKSSFPSSGSTVHALYSIAMQSQS